MQVQYKLRGVIVSDANLAPRGALHEQKGTLLHLCCLIPSCCQHQW